MKKKLIKLLIYPIVWKNVLDGFIHKPEILLILIKDTLNEIYGDNSSTYVGFMTCEGRIWPTEKDNLT